MNKFTVLKYGSMEIKDGHCTMKGWSIELRPTEAGIAIYMNKDGKILGYTPEEWATTKALEPFHFVTDGSQVERLTMHGDNDQPMLKVCLEG